MGEYLATGNPVVATNVSNITDYLEADKDIVLAKASNVESLKDVMEFCINNFAELKGVGINGKLKCEKFLIPILMVKI
ncbi:MAG: hypothetical protein IPJ23_05895 [Ignavibacteriales bacterium]|nr:hypothetical protein [Ignavibacteriales bacterium]